MALLDMMYCIIASLRTALCITARQLKQFAVGSRDGREAITASDRAYRSREASKDTSKPWQIHRGKREARREQHASSPDHRGNPGARRKRRSISRDNDTMGSLWTRHRESELDAAFDRSPGERRAGVERRALCGTAILSARCLGFHV
ncbi:hypothetical protein FKP32DRAFT_391815 [Trametes sanguinea]|nr:hypothetical protein FKP32DRAFT_391815 [Trametes sanguinea]